MIPAQANSAASNNDHGDSDSVPQGSLKAKRRIGGRSSRKGHASSPSAALNGRSPRSERAASSRRVERGSRTRRNNRNGTIDRKSSGSGEIEDDDDDF